MLVTNCPASYQFLNQGVIRCMSHRSRKYTGSVRRTDWDYRWPAWYFITICTDRRIPYFGEVRDGIVALTSTGCVAARYWQKIPELNERAVLDEFVVMPNHVHGLLGLKLDREPGPKRMRESNATMKNEALLESNDASNAFEPSEDIDSRMSRISPEAGSVSVIIRSFKSAVTKRVRGSLRTDFGWQPRFDDHIVRNERALRDIRQYIATNPVRWKSDRHHPDRSHPQ